jgi:hypothetical protein
MDRAAPDRVPVLLHSQPKPGEAQLTQELLAVFLKKKRGYTTCSVLQFTTAAAAALLISTSDELLDANMQTHAL